MLGFRGSRAGSRGACGQLCDLTIGKEIELLEPLPLHDSAVQRIAFYHCIPADVCGDEPEQTVLWDPTASEVFIYTPAPLRPLAFDGYRPGPRQYNPRLVD